MKKIFSFIIFLFLAMNFLFCYETVKATKITSNPSDYKGKNVLIYVKFGNISYEDKAKNFGYFEDFNVKGLKFRYQLNNENFSKDLKKLKVRDLITVKGNVILDGFDIIVNVHEFVKGWMDTTLLPPTPDEIEISCPKCGHKFKYKVTKDDYKNSILNKRDKNDITPEAPSPKSATKKQTQEPEEIQTEKEPENRSISRDLNREKKEDEWAF